MSFDQRWSAPWWRWSRLAQHVHTLSLRTSKPTIRRTELQDIPVNFSTYVGPLLDQGLFLYLHISSATRSIFCSVLTVLSRPLPAFREIEFVMSILQMISNRSDCPLLVRKPLQIRFTRHPFPQRRSLIGNLSSLVKGMFINKPWRNNDVTLMTLHCVSCSRFIYWVPVLELLKIFAQNPHIYHRNDCTLACIIHFVYILVLEDVIGSDVEGRFILAHTVCKVQVTWLQGAHLAATVG